MGGRYLRNPEDGGAGRPGLCLCGKGKAEGGDGVPRPESVHHPFLARERGDQRQDRDERAGGDPLRAARGAQRFAEQPGALQPDQSRIGAGQERLYGERPVRRPEPQRLARAFHGCCSGRLPPRLAEPLRGSPDLAVAQTGYYDT